MWAVVLLIALSMVTFSIFYLVPRLGGATPETLAARYVGRAATAETVHATAEKLGLLDPVPVQYWHWLKGILLGASYDYGAGVERCPAPCLGYSFITKQPVWPELLDRASVTISLVVGASIIWLIAGVSVGVISALRRGTIFDRGAMGVALAGAAATTVAAAPIARPVALPELQNSPASSGGRAPDGTEVEQARHWRRRRRWLFARRHPRRVYYVRRRRRYRW